MIFDKKNTWLSILKKKKVKEEVSNLIFNKKDIKRLTPKVLLGLIEKMRVVIEGQKGKNGLNLRVSNAETANESNRKAINRQKKKNIIFACALASLYLQVSSIREYIDERNYIEILKVIKQLLKLMGIF